MRFAGGIESLLLIARTMAAAVGDLLLPDVCHGCRTEPPQIHGLCESCAVNLLMLAGLPYCPRCGTTLGPHIDVAYEAGCAACPNPLPRFARVVRLGPYAPPLQEMIRELKYRRHAAMVPRLGQLLAEAVDGCEDVGDLDVVAPVPAWWARRLRRGIDHAALLAEALSRNIHLPLAPLLQRTRNTPPQVGRSRTQRIANMRGAFQANGEDISGARVLLVDDVTTSGATASECARTLLQAGALRVTLAVIAKAESGDAYAPRLQTANDVTSMD